MGYKIEYGDTAVKKKAARISKRKVIAVVAGVMVLSLTLTVAFWPQGRIILRDMVLPGDEAVTADALQNLVTDLRAGEEVYDAVAVFCQQIIRESGL